MDPSTPVVLDVNVYLDYIVGDDGEWPLLPAPPPPRSSNPSADVVALAFDERFRLFASPHILRNVHEKMLELGLEERQADAYVDLIREMCDASGGGVVDPLVRDAGIGDFEDSHIVALAKDPVVDAVIVVSSDSDLLDPGPAWNGRLMMHPRDVVRHAM